MNRPPRIVIANAYSRTNSGDGLLVDESARLALEAFPSAELSLIAMAPSSFPEYPHALNPVSGPSEDMPWHRVARVFLTRLPHPAVRDLLRDADLVLAVGGGYLRANTPVAALKSLISHASQAPRREAPPYIYLPQSIGPLPPRGLHTSFERLKRAERVYVRDDRSLAECLQHGFPAVRAPDLAVMAIADRWSGTSLDDQNRSRPARIGLVARSLPDRHGYVDKVRHLAALPGVELLVQSAGRGNDDPSFYESIGRPGPHRTLKEALASADRPDVTISVRMHGALESILAGVPSVHLSYERKGWGAFEDLGVGEYVHHAWRFDGDDVMGQALEIADRPDAFWKQIEASIPRLRVARGALTRAIRDATPGRRS